MLDDYPQVTPGPPKPSVILEPRVFSLPPGTERYVVEGGGAVLIPVSAGDHLTIINDEGGQRAEVLAADSKGGIDAGIIGAAGQGPAGGLQQLVTGSDASLRGLRMGVEARGIDLSQPGAVHLFEATTPAKTQADFQVARDGVVLVAAPIQNQQGYMDLEAQDTATPLTIMVKRAVIKRHVGFELPDPLATLDKTFGCIRKRPRRISSRPGITSRSLMQLGGNARILSVFLRASWTKGSNMRWM